MGNHISLLHQITELDNALHHPGDGGAHHPAGGVPLDDTGNAGIGLGGALIDDSAQMVATVGFDHRIAVAPRLKARAEGHRNVGHLLVGAEVLLGEDGIHQIAGLELGEGGAVGVNQ